MATLVHELDLPDLPDRTGEDPRTRTEYVLPESEWLVRGPFGYEVVRCDEGLPCMIVSLSSDGPTRGMHRAPANLGVSALARKVAEPDPGLNWSIDPQDFLKGTTYPVPAA